MGNDSKNLVDGVDTIVYRIMLQGLNIKVLHLFKVLNIFLLHVYDHALKLFLKKKEGLFRTF